MTLRTALATIRFLAVGPTVHLLSPPEGGGEPPNLRLLAYRGATCGAIARVTLADGEALLTLERNGEADGNDELETWRLLSRIAVRLGDYRLPLRIRGASRHACDHGLCVEDGFERDGDGDYLRAPTVFVRPAAARAGDMEAVYSDPFSIPWNFVPIEADLLRYIDIDPYQSKNPRVLDLGCGFGKNAVLLEHLGFEVYGIDLATAAIRRCREIVQRPDRFVAGSVTDLPWPDAAFDTVLDVGCLHCLPKVDQQPAIREIARVLSAEGYLLSRLFKPKDPQWLAQQPFTAKAFGLTLADVLHLFATTFTIRELEQTDTTHYVKAHPIRLQAK